MTAPQPNPPVSGDLFATQQKPPMAAVPDKLGHARISREDARDILTRATGFMDAYDFTLNPYSGCSFGCTYCYAAFFARGGYSPNTWGKWVRVKQNALALLKKYKPERLDGKLIYMSSVTDPYQPIEKKLELTRSLLKVLVARTQACGSDQKSGGYQRLRFVSANYGSRRARSGEYDGYHRQRRYSSLF